MIGALTFQQQQLLTRLLHAFNPEWDINGNDAALGRARDLAPGPDLACAAIRAATTPGNRTPAIIALPGPHWRASSTDPRHTSATAGDRCAICAEYEPRCRAIWERDHAFVSITEHKRSLRKNGDQ